MDMKLFPFTLNQFEKVFKESTERLQLKKLKLTPHCLRHGGASHDYLFGVRALSLLSPEQLHAAKQAALELPRQLLTCYR